MADQVMVSKSDFIKLVKSKEFLWNSFINTINQDGNELREFYKSLDNIDLNDTTIKSKLLTPLYTTQFYVLYSNSISTIISNINDSITSSSTVLTGDDRFNIQTNIDLIYNTSNNELISTLTEYVNNIISAINAFEFTKQLKTVVYRNIDNILELSSVHKTKFSEYDIFTNHLNTIKLFVDSKNPKITEDVQPNVFLSKTERSNILTETTECQKIILKLTLNKINDKINNIISLVNSENFTNAHTVALNNALLYIKDYVNSNGVLLSNEIVKVNNAVSNISIITNTKTPSNTEKTNILSKLTNIQTIIDSDNTGFTQKVPDLKTNITLLISLINKDKLLAEDLTNIYSLLTTIIGLISDNIIILSNNEKQVIEEYVSLSVQSNNILSVDSYFKYKKIILTNPTLTFEIYTDYLKNKSTYPTLTLTIYREFLSLQVTYTNLILPTYLEFLKQKITYTSLTLPNYLEYLDNCLSIPDLSLSIYLEWAPSKLLISLTNYIKYKTVKKAYSFLTLDNYIDFLNTQANNRPALVINQYVDYLSYKVQFSTLSIGVYLEYLKNVGIYKDLVLSTYLDYTTNGTAITLEQYLEYINYKKTYTKLTVNDYNDFLQEQQSYPALTYPKYINYQNNHSINTSLTIPQYLGTLELNLSDILTEIQKISTTLQPTPTPAP